MPDATPSSAELAAEPIVFVVDDDLSVRESLEMLIAAGGWRSAIFDSANAFLTAPPPSTPSCLLLDVNMPDLNGLDLQGMVTSSSVRMPIIFISGYRDVPATVRALKAGAMDFLTKPLNSTELLGAIRSALARSEELRREDDAQERLQRLYDALTPREREIMVRMTKGLLNKQIAYELGISEITVKAHRGRLMKKMGACSLPELMKMAARLRIDGDPDT
ncbi:response regulator transcription factor [Rhizobium lentis]|uniref:response regulator transcription factor n=1 Tax=Rhizobium lentis TaxID=1138194 RepID=UPI001C831727|nr:response regulator [Rhizobium lentis]MBX5014977.1 response regulator transcription factor [Rhizobium lentis]